MERLFHSCVYEYTPLAKISLTVTCVCLAPTIVDISNETNEKLYRKVAFLICLRKWLILGLKAEKQLRN